MSDPGLRDCVHNVVRIGIGDRTCPIPYVCYNTRMQSRTSRYRRKLLELYSGKAPKLVSD
jgi:hypothetical protein